MDNISKKVLDQIKEENIKPIPRWRFLLKDSVTWVTFILSIIIGGIGTSIMLYLIANNDLLSISFTGLSPLQTLVMSIPIFWLFITVFFIFLAYYNFKHTPDGYRLNVAKIFLVSIVGSLVLGWTINYTELSGNLNALLDKAFPYYTQMADPRYQVWMRPEAGYLAGRIQSVNTDNNTFVLKDLNKNTWDINQSDAVIKPAVEVTEGNEIKIIGTKTTDNGFKADEVRPWSGKMQGNVKGIEQGHGKNMQEKDPE